MPSFRVKHIPEETGDLKKWYNEVADSFLRRVGIKENDVVLDFGCGAGNYVFPIAKIVGQKGKVYALDKEKLVIDEITIKSSKLGLDTQIIPIKTDGGLKVPLEKNSVDVTILFDVLGAIIRRNSVDEVLHFLEELSRITKDDGTLILALKHTSNWKNWGMSKERVLDLVQRYFIIDREEVLTHLHWDFLEDDTIIMLSKI